MKFKWNLEQVNFWSISFLLPSYEHTRIENIIVLCILIYYYCSYFQVQAEFKSYYLSKFFWKECECDMLSVSVSWWSKYKNGIYHAWVWVWVWKGGMSMTESYLAQPYAASYAQSCSLQYCQTDYKHLWHQHGISLQSALYPVPSPDLHSHSGCTEIWRK